ncbi:PREDICTED: jasmonate O-methyltransferase [Nelumbo nucifera]|uniref:Jasmonate O-methyltransferase n=1 Tax=Nelumbo nucifera TaxID=4432 RepID=A0A1U8AMF3_NELNU|nr:PREDICTED: jasmonate O-methyltransferase [Nelumbo nucifera]
MVVVQALHMNGGTGETSYAKNSVVQNKIMSIGKPMIEEAILKLYSTTNNSPESFAIADLGCSSGPNTLLLVSHVMDIVCRRCCQLDCAPPEFRVFLNDLPWNDYNTLFRSLPAFYNTLKEDKGSGLLGSSCFIAGMPGSFYGRLFPRKSLHFVHSSSSLHWLSQVPPGLDSKSTPPLNKGKLFISKTSPPSVLSSYALQFQEDFTSFLSSRSEEMVPGGRMVLSFMGRRSADPTTEENCHQWELLAQALHTMVIEGHVEEEKLDRFNAPYYSPSPEEVKSAVQREGSFMIDRIEILEVEWDGGSNNHVVSNGTSDNLTGAQRVVKTVRAVVESMLASHFGEEIMDELFSRYGNIVSDYMSRKRAKYDNMIVSMTRKSY